MRSLVMGLLMVGCGGFVGAVARFAVSEWLQGSHGPGGLPWGTIAVNLLGCLLIGAVAGLIEVRDSFNPELRMFVLVGLLGGFTTFSTFGYEAFAMLREAAYLRAVLYMGIQVVAGLALVALGFAAATRWA